MSIAYEIEKLVLHTAAGADADGVVVDCQGLATMCAQLTGTMTSMSVIWEGSVDGTNYIGLLGWNRTTGVKALTATAVGLYVINVTGLKYFRARVDYTTGDVTVTVKGSSLPTTTLVTAS
jgi:hypothetical protein